ncbi:MAG: hypothetical protein KDD66_18495 [Bdellovibrionales bacterium]|nr:hypothetical protein [Bdellovibrionales bacterium]
MSTNFEEVYDRYVALAQGRSLPADLIDFVNGIPAVPEAEGSKWHTMLLAILGDQEAKAELGIDRDTTLDQLPEACLKAVWAIAPDCPRTLEAIERRCADQTRPHAWALAWYLKRQGELPQVPFGIWVMMNRRDVLPTAA